jgi:hypothetical protein
MHSKVLSLLVMMDRLGQLLLGTGLLNYGAQQACGLNRDEAMWHLHQAAKLDPTLQHANVSHSTDLHDDVLVRDPHWETGVVTSTADQSISATPSFPSLTRQTEATRV